MTKPISLNCYSQLDPGTIIVVIQFGDEEPVVYSTKDPLRAIERIASWLGDGDWVDLSSATQEELAQVRQEIKDYFNTHSKEYVTAYIRDPARVDLQPRDVDYLFDILPRR